MKILIIGKYYHPHIGGVETVMRQQAEFLVSKGYDVTVLVCKNETGSKTETFVINSVKVVACKTLMFVRAMPISYELAQYYYKYKGKFDVIHIHEPFPVASFLLAISGRVERLVVTWHSDIVRQKYLRYAVWPFQYVTLRKSDVIITTSPKLLLSSKLLSKFKQKATTIPLSVEPSLYKVGKNKDDFIEGEYFLFFGRLSYYKGLKVLLDALSYVDLMGLKLVIAGKGELAESVKKSIKDMQLSEKVILLNSVISNEEKIRLLRNCAFYVFPSTHPSEAFGITQLEAMASGKAVINTLLPTGVPWVSRHKETGLTVPPGNSMLLAEAINRLIRYVDERKEYENNARQRVLNEFSDEVVFRKLERVYSALHDQSRGGVC